MSDAQQLQHARGHVGEFKDASPLVDCGRLEANQRSEARAIQMFYIAKVDNDATAKKDEGLSTSFISPAVLLTSSP